MSTHFIRHVIAAALCLASWSSPQAWADSFTSSASSAGSKSSGSLSDSVGASSNSSSPDTKKAAGVYRVEHLAELAHKPGHLRLHLMPLDQPGAASALWLDLPRATVQAQQLAAQALIELRQRAYGLEVAQLAPSDRSGSRAPSATATPFFLLLADDWRQALESRAVTL